jgi:hypothetical protein
MKNYLQVSPSFVGLRRSRAGWWMFVMAASGAAGFMPAFLDYA